MPKKSVVIGLFILAIGLCSGVQLHAQIPPVGYVACGIDSFNEACAPTLPADAHNCQQSGDYSTNDYALTCEVNKSTPPCASCNNIALPIDAATGDTYVTQTDIKVPGLGGGLTLSRSWHSIPFSTRSTLGIFGPNWTSSFEENIFVDLGNFVTYLHGDGRVSWFVFGSWDTDGNPKFSAGAPARQMATLTQKSAQTNPNWTLIFQNGEKRVFDWSSGKLLSITDRNGNTTSLNYDDSFRLSSVADPAGRHLYFAYSLTSRYLVTAVTSDFGVSLQYAYDDQGRLTQVTEPDQTTISYQYDQLSRISSILDSNQKVLESHTYNTCGQGLTSSRAGSAESVTVSYTLPCAFAVPAAAFLTKQQ